MENNKIFDYDDEVCKLKLYLTHLTPELSKELAGKCNINIFLHKDEYIRSTSIRLLSKFLNNSSSLLLVKYHDMDLLIDEITMYITLTGITMDSQYSDISNEIVKGVINLLNR